LELLDAPAIEEECFGGILLAAEPSVSWRAVSHLNFSTEPATYIIVLGSLRIRNLTPWSANDRERKVDSIIPGKLFGGDTASLVSSDSTTLVEVILPVNRSEMMVFK
jgi:hypothetical protein